MTGIRRLPVATRRSGRPPKAELTDSERRGTNLAAEVLTVDLVPTPPVILNSDYGRRQWTTLCEILIRRQCLSPDFYPALTNICRALERLLEVEGQIEREGSVIYKRTRTGPDKDDYGMVPDKAHPLNKEWTLLWSAVRAGLSDFGLTPASAKATNCRPIMPAETEAKQGVSSRSRSSSEDFDPS